MKSLLVVFAAAIWSAECSAQSTILFEADHPRFGEKSLTVDSRTGLIFLDLTQTLDLTVREIRQEMLPGGDFFGFRHAGAGEVGSLYLSAGFTPSYTPVGSPQFGNVLRFIELVGSTYESHGYPATMGIMNDQYVAFIQFSVIANSYYVPNPSGKQIHLNDESRTHRSATGLLFLNRHP